MVENAPFLHHLNNLLRRQVPAAQCRNSLPADLQIPELAGRMVGLTRPLSQPLITQTKNRGKVTNSIPHITITNLENLNPTPLLSELHKIARRQASTLPTFEIEADNVILELSGGHSLWHMPTSRLNGLHHLILIGQRSIFSLFIADCHVRRPDTRHSLCHDFRFRIGNALTFFRT